MNKLREEINRKIHENQNKLFAEWNAYYMLIATSLFCFVILILYTFRNFNPSVIPVPKYHTYGFVEIVLSTAFGWISFYQYKNDNLKYGVYALIFSTICIFIFNLSMYRSWETLKIWKNNFNQFQLSFMSYMMLTVFHFFHTLGLIFYQIYLIFLHNKYLIHKKSIDKIKLSVYFSTYLTIVASLILIIFI